MDMDKLPPSEPDAAWSYVGVITFIDPPREDTADTIAKAIELSVKVKMITGDQIKIGKNMATTIGLGSDIQLWKGPDLLTDDKGNPIIPKTLGSQMGPSIEACDGFAQVYPEHKFLIVEALKQRGFSVGMTGDGVNDAPALKVANIGIAVQGATTAAQAASDIVLTQEGLGTIVLAIVEARKIFQRLRNYVVYRISCTIQLLLFFFIGVVLIKLSAYYPSGKDCNGTASPHIAAWRKSWACWTRPARSRSTLCRHTGCTSITRPRRWARANARSITTPGSRTTRSTDGLAKTATVTPRGRTMART
jgi:hypothetical protein